MKILRGEKLQLAMGLVADGEMNHWEIARHLGVSSRMLEFTREQPFFKKRVAEIRAGTITVPAAFWARRVKPMLDKHLSVTADTSREKVHREHLIHSRP
jgi:hypothetical protein